MNRLRTPLNRQLGLCLDSPVKHRPNEEIREALLQALADLLREALDAQWIEEPPQKGAANEPETNA